MQMAQLAADNSTALLIQKLDRVRDDGRQIGVLDPFFAVPVDDLAVVVADRDVIFIDFDVHHVHQPCRLGVFFVGKIWSGLGGFWSDPVP